MMLFVPRPGFASLLAKWGPLGLKVAITAEAIESEARRRVTVLSGETQGTGRVEGSDEGRRVVFGSAAKFLEFGTSKMDAQPFLRPAADAIVPGGRRGG